VLSPLKSFGHYNRGVAKESNNVAGEELIILLLNVQNEHSYGREYSEM
jgi:hypothetical protein